MIALLLLLYAAEYEIRGEIQPPASAAVSLHAVSDPYSESTLTDPGGRFRFRKVQPGTYTIAVFVPRRGETRQTIVVGPGTADRQRRVAVQIRTDGAALARDAAAKVSARELTIPEAARRALAAALKKITARDIAGAITHLEAAVQTSPQFAAAWNQLGTIAYQTQRYEDAERYFRRGIEADPELYEPVVNLGGVLIHLGNLEEAWKYNVEAVLRRPNDALAQAQLGITYLVMNKLPVAEKHLLEACRLDPAHFSHPQIHLAEVYIRRNDRTRATEQLEEFLRYHPDTPNAASIRETIAKWRAP